MSGAPLRILLLGGPIPPAVTEALAGVATLVTDGDAAAVDAVVTADTPDAEEAIACARRADRPAFVVAAGAVDLAARLGWIRRGADDLLPPARVAETLVRRLRGGAEAGAPRYGQADAGLRVDRWLRAMERYLSARAELVGRLGDGGLARWVDAALVRDRVLQSSDTDLPADAFGQRRGGERLHWPVTFAEPAGSGEILHLGADGVCLGTGSAPGERLVMEVDAGALRGVVRLEVRWQRRAGRDRWEVGALVTEVRLARSG